jgi:uncharacterized protein (DUF2267 family)
MMSEQGLETIDAENARVDCALAESMHMNKRDSWKSLRSALQTLRDRLPIDLTVHAHFGAQLPMLVRPLLGRMGSVERPPIKMSRKEFRPVVQSRIVADRVFAPVETVQTVLAGVANHIGNGEMQEIMDAFPRDLQSFFPALASAG